MALRGISKKMKVAAAQRVVMSFRAQQCSPVGDHLEPWLPGCRVLPGRVAGLPGRCRVSAGLPGAGLVIEYARCRVVSTAKGASAASSLLFIACGTGARHQ